MMVRIVIEYVLLFLLPSILYFTFLVAKRRGKIQKSSQVFMEEAPLVWLVGAGAAVVIVVLAVFATSSGGKPGEGYLPPVFKDGKILHGRKQAPSP